MLRKVVVFPIANPQSKTASTTSEEAWWQMRELLTKDQKFLVASRRFMINRGVFQPRTNLKPADAIILGKILDAQVLITSWLEERMFKMRAYHAESGYLLWEGEVVFHPAIPVQDQLIKVSSKLLSDFIQALPYQGFQIVDSVIGKVVYEKDSKKFALVFVGQNQKIQVGDPVHWIAATGPTTTAFLQQMEVIVVAEGTVTEVKEDRVEVEILKWRSEDDLKSDALVRFPQEVARLREQFFGDDRPSNLSAEYLSAEMRGVQESSRETHPTATALAFILNLATMILLIF